MLAGNFHGKMGKQMKATNYLHFVSIAALMGLPSKQSACQKIEIEQG